MDCINRYVFFYIIAFSFQISGAVILLKYSALTKRDDVLKRFMKKKYVTRNDTTKTLEYDESAYKELFKVAMLNKVSFGYIAFGYLLSVWGDCSSVCKMFIAFAIVICSVLIMFLTNKGVLLWLRCSGEVKRKITNDDLERLGLEPDMEFESFPEKEQKE